MQDCQSRDGSARTDRQQLIDLEHQLSEARKRFADLRERSNLWDYSKVRGCKFCAGSSLQRNAEVDMTTLGRGLAFDTLFDLSHKYHVTSQDQGTEPSNHEDSGEEDKRLYDHAGGNADGLLLAVDKFLSSEERSQLPSITSMLPDYSSGRDATIRSKK